MIDIKTVPIDDVAVETAALLADMAADAPEGWAAPPQPMIPRGKLEESKPGAWQPPLEAKEWKKRRFHDLLRKHGGDIVSVPKEELEAFWEWYFDGAAKKP